MLCSPSPPSPSLSTLPYSSNANTNTFKNSGQRSMLNVSASRHLLNRTTSKAREVLCNQRWARLTEAFVQVSMDLSLQLLRKPKTNGSLLTQPTSVAEENGAKPQPGKINKSWGSVMSWLQSKRADARAKAEEVVSFMSP